jgi:threonylcarbamoyladenosine tRNA methylthiotransferase MtaB
LPAETLPRFVDGGSSSDMFACFSAMPVGGSRARPVLKIQDGCNAYCTYCIVPYARGKSVSMSPERVLDAVRQFSAAGYPEVVLTGIHLGAWGLDLTPPQSLYRLLVMIDDTAAIGRVRLSSVEPCELADEIIGLAATSRRVCDHFHLPLQSGSDTILKRMTRPYTAAFFKDRVKKIKAAMPDAAVGVDVLVGFPGEGDREFEETLALLNNLPVSYVHVFPFSPRPGTPACDFDGQVPPSIIRERCRVIRQLGAVRREQFSRRQKGRIATVRIEDERDRLSGCLKGVTSNYLTVLADGDDTLRNQDVRVRIGDPFVGLRVRAEIV